MRIKLIMISIVILNICLTASETEVSDKKGLIFKNLKDETKLVTYFLDNNQKRYFRKLNDDNKWKYIHAFWEAQDPNPNSSQNEFLREVKLRIDYANKYYTYFNQGWMTDRGKIHIRYGQPFEILKLQTGITNYSSKEYQIWKYRITSHRTYIFIDIQQNGNYRMIYSDGDPREGSWADWEKYLGEEFDESNLY